MKSTLIVAIFILFPLSAGAQPDGSIRVVSTAWLAEHLNDPNLVILQSGWTRGNYKSEHIPGALFLWLNGFSSDTPDLSTQLPDAVKVEPLLNELGITNKSKIVVYFEGQNVTMTARMILTFDYFGLGNQASYLDGGLDAWKREGRPVTKEISNPQKGTFKPSLHSEHIADAEWIARNLHDPNVKIIDARSARFYEGNGGGMPRPGHIPGAVNIPYSSVVDSTNLLLPRETLKEMFLKAGVNPGNKVVTYCHVGQQASLLYFVARSLGYDARLYDGSFEDWSGRENLPVDNPAEKH